MNLREEINRQRELMQLPDSDYRGEHTAPSKDDCPMYDLTGAYPEDIYGPDAVRLYGDNGDNDDARSISIIKNARNRPNAIVTIYRAVPDINIEVKSKLKPLYDIIDYYNKLGFFPLRNKIIYDLQDKYDINTYSYDEQQKLVLNDIHNQANNLTTQLKKPISIKNGDWVTISRPYAVLHGDSNLKGKYKIISKTTKAKNLYTDGNSIHEWGYWIED